MAEPQSPQDMLNQNIEREVRFQIGELTMQIIVLRQMLDLQQKMSQQQQPGDPIPDQPPQPPADRPVPQPPRQPQPQPAQPEPLPERRAMNGGDPYLRG
jgi:hypothetical protein